MSTRLPLTDGSLVLETSDGWCEVWLEVGSERTCLGGDSPESIRHRLLTHLAEPRSAAGEVDGSPVHWVLSLSERHCTLYVQFAPDGRRLLIQGPQCEWLWRGKLSDANWQAWQLALTDSGASGVGMK